MILTHCLALALSLASQDPTIEPVVEPPVEPAGDLRVARGQDAPALLVPRDERLVFSARVEVGFVAATVGTVTMRSTVGPYRSAVLLGADGADAPPRESGALSIRAVGDYLFYDLDTTIASRILPQDWPWIVFRSTQTGSEKRRRENLIGLRDGRWLTSYRRDTDHGAPVGQRIWAAPSEREVPERAVDMLSAVYLVRTMISEDLPLLRFPLIDKTRLWQMRVTKGRREAVETEAGTFDTVELVLSPSVYPGEVIDESRRERFEGLFGLHGSIRLWVEKNTGVPVLIEGELPVGPVDIGLEVRLESHSGTPAAFRAIG